MELVYFSKMFLCLVQLITDNYPIISTIIDTNDLFKVNLLLIHHCDMRKNSNWNQKLGSLKNAVKEDWLDCVLI